MFSTRLVCSVQLYHIGSSWRTLCIRAPRTYLHDCLFQVQALAPGNAFGREFQDFFVREIPNRETWSLFFRISHLCVLKHDPFCFSFVTFEIQLSHPGTCWHSLSGNNLICVRNQISIQLYQIPLSIGARSRNNNFKLFISSDCMHECRSIIYHTDRWLSRVITIIVTNRMRRQYYSIDRSASVCNT